MSFINHPGQLAPPLAASPHKLSIWRRTLDAVADGRPKASEQVPSDLIARNGGCLTDDVERQMALCLTNR
jgi:hypothetical protein